MTDNRPEHSSFSGRQAQAQIKHALQNDPKPLTDAKQPPIAITEEYPPCVACGGPNDIGELCKSCAKDNDPFPDEDKPGSWMARDAR